MTTTHTTPTDRSATDPSAPETIAADAAARPRVLGVSAGRADGSAEILLKAALAQIEATGAEVELVRLDDLRLPGGPETDESDAWWYWDRLLEADGVVISTPIISRTVAARLKVLSDFLLGPNADAAIIENTLAMRAAGHDALVPFRVDERVLRPRVAGFLSVGGSLTAQWKLLSLPVLHTQTLSMSIAVVDQAEFEGAGTPRSIVLDPAALERAERLGHNVASQLGRGLDDAEYLGEPGLCPLCHLSIVELAGPRVTCATCGARGELAADGGVTWTDLSTSVIGMTERRNHAVEIQEVAAAQNPRREEIERLAAPYAAWDRRITPSRDRGDQADQGGRNGQTDRGVHVEPAAGERADTPAGQAPSAVTTTGHAR